jgi:hypothetical protein
MKTKFYDQFGREVARFLVDLGLEANIFQARSRWIQRMPDTFYCWVASRLSLILAALYVMPP